MSQQRGDLPVARGGEHGASARHRLLIAAATGLVAGGTTAAAGLGDLAPLIGWDSAAVVVVGWVWLDIVRLDAERTAERAEREDPSVAWTDATLLSAAVASLAAVGLVLAGADTRSSGILAGRIGFAIGSVLLSWTLVHTVFTLRYARIYYTGIDGGVDFHDAAPPNYLDFAYLAFTVGMTFQVSDTELNSGEVRRTVLRHALLSYLFGAVIVAGAINLVAGVTR